jgi:NACHT domain
MPFLETLTLEVGASIAKALLTRWFNDADIISSTGSTVIDVIKTHTSDRIAQQRAQRQFETIGEKVAESMLPIFEVEGAGLDESTRTAIALAVAETLNGATSEMLAQRNFEPAAIANQLIIHSAHLYHFSETEEHLYKRIVAESCEYIVDIASQLPHFTEKTLTEILKREGHLITITEHILQEVARLRAELDPKTEAARFELEYRRAVVRRLDELELFGAGVSVTSRKYSLNLAYIALSLEQKVIQTYFSNEKDLKPSFPDKEMISKTINKAISVNDLLSETKCLLIRGDAGSGKTTLLQWIAVQSAAQSFPPQLQEWNTTIPFYIRLRQHVQSEPSATPRWPTPETFPGLIAPTIAGVMPHGWAHQQLEQGHAIMLIDGIDEVPPSQRESIHTWISELLMTYPHARIILTSRPYAIKEDELSIQGFKDAYLLPMDEPNIELFIDQWHTAIAANIQDSEKQAHLSDAAKRLKEEVKNARAKQALATNPLLCAMLCALNQERHQELPSDRIMLYDACCELLIERRDVERRILLTEYPAAILSYAQKTLLLSDLAYWLIRNGWSEADLQTVDQRFTQQLVRMPKVKQRIDGKDVRLLFTERSGIIREPMIGAIDFAHRTFQEFLAAKAVVDEGDIGVLVQHAHDYQWHEVVTLAAGLAPKRVREDLAEQLLGRGETEKTYRSQLYLLAAACTQVSQEEVNFNTKLRIERRLNALLPLKKARDVEALAAAGTLALPYLHPNIYSSIDVTVACIRALTHIGGKEALEVLMEYTNDFTPSVLEAMVIGLENFDDKSTYIQRLLSHINSLIFHGYIPKNTSVLSQMPHLTSLTLSNIPIGDLSFLAQMPHLTSLALNNISIGDLSFLAQMSQVTSLALNDIHIGNLSFLAQMPQVISLALNNIPIGNLRFLAQMPQATSLALYNTHTSDLSFLAQMPNLTSLALYNILTADLSFLTKMPYLDYLTLYKINTSNLRFLTKITQITSLALNDIHTGNLSFLAQMPNLTSLALYNVIIGDLSFLAQMTHLDSLTLYKINIGDLSFLAQMTHLTSLALNSTSISISKQPLYLPFLTKLTRL